MFGNLVRQKISRQVWQKMLIGIPDYDNYVTHMQTNHPDQPYMTCEEFFRERQQARYGGDGARRCC
ncbi:putative selenoprotein [Klebsiella pneumoniae]|nr:putative selenoprotein [Klebsiella pneumoniae]